jgi:ATP-binding cassette subfamily B protein
MPKFPSFRQQDYMDCGPTCLRIVSMYFGRGIPIQALRSHCFITREGTNLLALSHAAEIIGFQSTGVRLTMESLKDVDLPCILHWRQDHYVVLYKVKKNIYFISDPASGLIELSEAKFKSNWIPTNNLDSGTALLLDPTPAFYKQKGIDYQISWTSILSHFYKYKQLVIQLILGLILSSIFSLIAPFLTQSIVDGGIKTQDISFVYLILIAQIMLFIGSTIVDFIRAWLLLHISTRVNLSILTDFLIKLMKLPIGYFASKTTGDIMQRMNDQQRIEFFLTGTTLTAMLSIFNLFIYTTLLLHYSAKIFILSMVSTLFYAIWISLFLERRRQLNYNQFSNSSANQTTIVELVNGIQDIKLYNCEEEKRWGWERIQASYFKFKNENLSLDQYQQGGSIFINHAKNIIVTFLSVKAVIDGELTLGGMMAIQYIVGQLSTPIDQILGYVQAYQDAKISIERLNEIYTLSDEESLDKDWLMAVPQKKDIIIQNLSFKYPGPGNENVLNNVNLVIPEGKTTAIVGMSGSGKTTILKLLLRFHEVEHGSITVDRTALDKISFKVWRNSCGTVMQDGFLFQDTIENNIALGERVIDQKKLSTAIKVANLDDLIETLPFGLQTKIGPSSNGLSQGQRQRLLIARAVYKNPDFLFFDEATNSLDAKNEMIIMKNLNLFFNGKTVVTVAHRLSTVTNADNIIVLNKGTVTEQGTHKDLVLKKGEYYNLIRNQLELGL